MRNSMLLKFMKIFIFLIVIPILGINILLNQTYEKLLLSYYTGKMQQNMEQMGVNIEDEIKRVSLLTSTIAYDEDMLKQVTTWHNEENIQEKLQLSKRIDGRLRTLFNFNGDITSAIFFLRGGGYYHYNNNLHIEESDARRLPWYRQLLTQPGKVIKLGTNKTITRTSNHSKHLAVAISPMLHHETIDIEAIYLEVRTSIFNSVYSNVDEDRYGDTLIFDSEGEVVAASSRPKRIANEDELLQVKDIFLKENHVTLQKLGEGNNYISTYFTHKSHWMIANVIDYGILTSETKGIMTMFSIIYIIVLLLFIVFTLLFFREMIIPIKKLEKIMKGAQAGRLDQLVAVQGPQEIKSLGKSYNKMIGEINELIMAIDLKEKERTREEIKALQAQINPHFIYNTLNSIRLMAMMSQHEGIRIMTDSFMKIISTTFGDESTLITLADEMTYIESYVYVMQVRYGDHFTVETHMDEELMNYKIVRMLLQPIVENAILHGVSENEGDSTISIHITCIRDKLIVDVTDYGIGMTQEEIACALAEEGEHRRSFNHIGIKNVERRIKLNFGDEYGLEIISEKEVYTTVRLSLPKIT